jgi:predicted amidohydrolase
MPAPLRIACLAMTATDVPAANADQIRQGLLAASRAGARVLLTPECALPGYPGAARTDVANASTCHLAELEDTLALLAERLGLVLVLGTASPTADGAFSNDALCCGAVAPRRHRKRALTPGDHAHFQAGSSPTVLEIDGWRLGVSICYEVRFPELWADADGYVAIAHMAGLDPDPGTKAQIVPALYAARAAEWAAPLALCNTAADDRWLDSSLWDARGVRVETTGVGLLCGELVHREELPAWYAGLRRDRLELGGYDGETRPGR